MKYIFCLFFVLFLIQKSNAQLLKNFDERTLRLDYFHCGNATSEQFYFDELIEEPHWAGSSTKLIDTNGYGNHFVEVRLAETGELIFSRGFCTLFDEWQTTDQARMTDCCYPESVVMPFPRNKVLVSILSRNKSGVFEKKFEYAVDPKSHFIRKEHKKLPVFDVLNSGPVDKKVDVVLLPEGYTVDQEELFKADCQKFTEEFFRYEPYTENKDKFNIRGVWSPSEEEGPDIPGEHVWNETALHASYYTFDSERYLMVKDFQGVREIAGNAPYDYIYILANTPKYGGGAIYNFYGISAAHHIDETGKIYIHEFGHLFAGLGDEYVGGVEYTGFYPLNVEPWEPNLTTLVDFNKKWKSMLPDGVEIPTQHKAFAKEKLGVYEGGGYESKGVYRPSYNCVMNNFHTIDVFCPVCIKAIKGMIEFNCR